MLLHRALHQGISTCLSPDCQLVTGGCHVSFRDRIISSHKFCGASKLARMSRSCNTRRAAAVLSSIETFPAGARVWKRQPLFRQTRISCMAARLGDFGLIE